MKPLEKLFDTLWIDIDLKNDNKDVNLYHFLKSKINNQIVRGIDSGKDKQANLKRTQEQESEDP